jgi:hypothetical protein
MWLMAIALWGTLPQLVVILIANQLIKQESALHAIQDIF